MVKKTWPKGHEIPSRFLHFEAASPEKTCLSLKKNRLVDLSCSVLCLFAFLSSNTLGIGHPKTFFLRCKPLFLAVKLGFFTLLIPSDDTWHLYALYSNLLGLANLIVSKWFSQPRSWLSIFLSPWALAVSRGLSLIVAEGQMCFFSFCFPFDKRAFQCLCN